MVGSIQFMKYLSWLPYRALEATMVGCKKKKNFHEQLGFANINAHDKLMNQV